MSRIISQAEYIEVSYEHIGIYGRYIAFEYSNTHVIIECVVASLRALVITVSRDKEGLPAFPVPNSMVAENFVDPVLKPCMEISEGVN